jgi:hypothetical protein
MDLLEAAEPLPLPAGSRCPGPGPVVGGMGVGGWIGEGGWGLLDWW